MTPLTDTSPDALRVQIDCYRRMPPARKWAILDEANRFARALHASGFRLRQPAASDAEVRRHWVRLHLGDGPWLTAARDTDMFQQPIEHQRVILDVLTAFDRTHISCAIGGSVASSLHGVPRYTQDADLTAEPFPGREESFSRQFGPEYYVSLDAVRQAVRDRGSFNIIHTTSGFKVDVFVQKMHRSIKTSWPVESSGRILTRPAKPSRFCPRKTYYSTSSNGSVSAAKRRTASGATFSGYCASRPVGLTMVTSTSGPRS